MREHLVEGLEERFELVHAEVDPMSPDALRPDLPCREGVFRIPRKNAVLVEPADISLCIDLLDGLG
jgi:hypothetical protein